MDLARLKTLIDQMASSGRPELEMVEGDEKIRMVRADRPQEGGAPLKPILSPARTATATPTTVNAPMFGVCHLSPSPGAPPFASVGNKIAVGQTLCLIEAMKMFASVAATDSGVLQAVLIESGTEVEAGQPLFRIE